MGCPLIGNPDGRWGNSRSPVPVDFCFCPVAVPTLTFGVARYVLTTGSSMEKYMSVAPDSTMPVAFVGSTICCRVWLYGLIFNVRLDMSRVVLKLAQGVKSVLLDLLIFLTVPHRHNELFQPGGRLSLFFTSSKHVSAT